MEVPPRAQAIRVLMTELNRVSSHLLFLATQGMDIGAVSMMIYGWREREIVLRFFEQVTGLRMNHNYIRPGGVAADLPDGWEDAVEQLLVDVPGGVGEYEELLNDEEVRRTIELEKFFVVLPPFGGTDDYTYDGSRGDKVDRPYVSATEPASAIQLLLSTH